MALLEKMEGMQEEAMTAAKRAENALALKEEELAKTLVLLEHERTLIEQLKEDLQSQFRVRTDPAGPGRGRGRAGPGGERGDRTMVSAGGGARVRLARVRGRMGRRRAVAASRPGFAGPPALPPAPSGRGAAWGEDLQEVK